MSRICRVHVGLICGLHYVGYNLRCVLPKVNIIRAMQEALRNLGRNIAKARKAQKLTQEDLAGLAEMDRSYLSEVENGRKNISILALIKIATALQMNCKELL